MNDTPSITAEVADFVEEFQLADAVADELLGRAAAAFFDTIAVSLAASADEAVELALTWAQDSYPAKRASLSTLGVCNAMSALGAAFVGGTAAHAFDYDDVSAGVHGHPSALLVPLLLALGEEEGIDGRHVLECYLLGVHVTSAVALGMDAKAHYARGWHATSSLGAIGAAAAAARLLGLSKKQTRNAVGIAGSRAAGSRANFGSMTKPLHVGNAAGDAVMAARLAQRGFTANEEQLEAPFGFIALYGGPKADPLLIPEALWGPVDRFAGKIDMKRYPCCYQTQRALDATIELRGEIEDQSKIAKINVIASPGSTSALIHPQPETPLEAKFSMPYTVAAAFIDGFVGLETFTDERFARLEVHELAKKVELAEEAVPPMGPAEWERNYAVVRVSGRDFDRSTRTDIPKGEYRRPLSESELRTKVADCLSFGRVALSTPILEQAVMTLHASATLEHLASVLPQR